MTLPDNREIPCFLCGEILVVKLTKNGKPYFICQQCGLQAFIRCRQGIRTLKRLLKTIAEEGDTFMSISQSSFQTLSLLSRLNELNRKLDRVKQNKLLTDRSLTGTETELPEKALAMEIRLVKSALFPSG